MQQTRLPERKKEQKLVTPPEIKRDPVLDQVISDLQNAGVPLENDMRTLEGNIPIINNPEITAENRAAALEDLITVWEGNLKSIDEARKQPEIAGKEGSDPKYKQTMDNLVTNLNDAVHDLQKARLAFVKAYTKA